MTTLERSTIPTEDHLRAWFMSSVRLDLHLEATHGIAAPSNPADWATLHALRHETHQDHSLETVKPCPCEFDQWPKFTLEWHRKYKVHHLASFPAVADDKSTVHALDQAIRQTIREAAARWLAEHPDVSNLCGVAALHLEEFGLEMRMGWWDGALAHPDGVEHCWNVDQHGTIYDLTLSQFTGGEPRLDVFPADSFDAGWYREATADDISPIRLLAEGPTPEVAEHLGGRE